MVVTIESQTNDKRFNAMLERYVQFVAASDKVDRLPVRVFEPLSQQQIDEINMLRKISFHLQTKKEEDLLKAKQTAEEAASEAKSVSETKEESLEDKEKDATKEPTHSE